MTFLYYTFTIIIQTIFNSVNFFYLLNCHNHSYSLQSVTYLYLCHNDVNCLRFRGAYLFAGRIKEQKFQISTRFQNENNNPLSSLNKIYVFTSWPQNIFACKTTIEHPTQYHFFLHSNFKTSAQTTVRTKAACANINQAVVLKKAFWLLKKMHIFFNVEISIVQIVNKLSPCKFYSQLLKKHQIWKKYVTPGISNLSNLFILHFITYKC